MDETGTATGVVEKGIPLNNEIKLGIGTVQFGLHYGISNSEGQTPQGEVVKILATAKESGIQYLDTAFGYGESEKVLGQTIPSDADFYIVTKTPAIQKNVITDSDTQKLRESFDISCQNFNAKKVYGLLIHNASDLLSPGGESLFLEMKRLKNAGRVQKIGVSVYPEDDVFSILSRFDIDLIQVPLNVFDQRLLSSGLIAECKKRNIEIHSRSLFLQGLLLMPIEQIPSFFDPIKPIISRYHSFCKKNSLSLVEGAYCFVQSVNLIDVVIVGINNADQLIKNMDSFNKARQLKNIFDFEAFAFSEPIFLNPSNWRLK
jgi:aryl-alcohol dehydrogenase-like predicted oxidoreductase